MEPMSQEALDVLRLACANRLLVAAKAMRAAQRAYFKDRRPSDLEQAKYYERAVDELLVEGAALKNEPPSLFDTGAKH